MEASPKTQERGSPTAALSTALVPSPTSNSSTSSSSNSQSNGHYHPAHNLHHHHYKLHPPPPSPPITPKEQQKNHQTITRSEPSNPCPTTFVQADTSSFKQVVQMLTGSSETAKLASQSKPATNPDHQSHHHLRQHHQQSMCRNPIPPVKTSSKLKPSKLYERRNSLKNLKINPLGPEFASNSGFSPRNAEILSPSMIDFPSLVLSPVTPLIPDPFNRSPSTFPNGKPNNNSTVVDKAAEEKAIAEKGFYLHPSPASTPRESEPRLLPLFPVSSPRVSGSDSNCS